MAIITKNSDLLANAAAVQAATLNTLTALLFKTAIAPLSTVTAAELVAAKANFNGYADQVGIDLDGPIINDDGLVELLTPNLIFIKTAGATANTIFGYAILNAALTSWFWFELFDTPQTVVNVGDAVSFVGRYNFPPPTSSVAPTE